jgi:hypothetical protein
MRPVSIPIYFPNPIYFPDNTEETKTLEKAVYGTHNKRIIVQSLMVDTILRMKKGELKKEKFIFNNKRRNERLSYLAMWKFYTISRALYKFGFSTEPIRRILTLASVSENANDSKVFVHTGDVYTSGEFVDFHYGINLFGLYDYLFIHRDEHLAFNEALKVSYSQCRSESIIEYFNKALKVPIPKEFETLVYRVCISEEEALLEECQFHESHLSQEELLPIRGRYSALLLPRDQQALCKLPYDVLSLPKNEKFTNNIVELGNSIHPLYPTSIAPSDLYDTIEFIFDTISPLF